MSHYVNGLGEKGGRSLIIPCNVNAQEGGRSGRKPLNAS